MTKTVRALGLTLLFTLLVQTGFAEIYEVSKLEEVYDYLSAECDRDTLIVFDIDNTLIEPVQELGTDQWFYHRIEDYIEAGHDARTALNRALREWVAIMNVTKIRLCEESAEAIVNDLQKQGYPVIGLTTRGLGLSTLTIEQLQEVGIDLSLAAPYEGDLLIKNQRSVLYRGGILFTAGTHKGEALHRFFESIDYPAKRVMFINDKKSHLEPVEEMCAREGFEFVGLRYGYTDSRVQNFRRDLAKVQMEHFGCILSDEEAEQAMR